jgi:hypothetical protein
LTCRALIGCIGAATTTNIAFEANATSLTAGDWAEITLLALDADGLVDQAFIDTVTLNDTGALIGPTDVQLQAGRGSFSVRSLATLSTVFAITSQHSMTTNATLTLSWTPAPTATIAMLDLGLSPVKSRLSNNVLVGDTLTIVVQALDTFGNLNTAESGEALLNATSIFQGTSNASFQDGVAEFQITSNLAQSLQLTASLARSSAIQTEPQNATFYRDANVVFRAMAPAVVGTSRQVELAIVNRAGAILTGLDLSLDLSFSGSGTGVKTVQVFSGEGSTRVRSFAAEEVVVSIVTISDPSISIATDAEVTFFPGIECNTMEYTLAPLLTSCYY